LPRFLIDQYLYPHERYIDTKLICKWFYSKLTTQRAEQEK
jgi:hypothetical protein